MAGTSAVRTDKTSLALVVSREPILRQKQNRRSEFYFIIRRREKQVKGEDSLVFLTLGTQD